MEERQHAILSASSAHRWLRCPPSARLEDELPEGLKNVGDEAREGSLAHAYAAKRLKMEVLGYTETPNEDAEIALLARYDSVDMAEYVDRYVNFVKGRIEETAERTKDYKVLIEERLDYSWWVPEGFGTGDCLIVSDGMTEVIDLKFGTGVKVNAPQNHQMKLYALGAYQTLSVYGYKDGKVKMTIVQPRLGHVSEWETDFSTLLTWGEEKLKPTAEEAWKGEGAFAEGEWCQFCKVSYKCNKLAITAMQEYLENEDKVMSLRAMARLLHILPRIKRWIAKVEDTAKEQLTYSIVGLPGWKLEKRKGVRQFTDKESAISAMEIAGYGDETIFEQRKMKSVAALEKELGKRKFKEIFNGVEIIQPITGDKVVPDDMADVEADWKRIDETTVYY